MSRAYHVDDDVVAPASASGGAARAVVRISGPGAVQRLVASFTPSAGDAVPRRGAPRVVLGRMALEGFAAPLDCEAYVWPTDRSYTRQPLVEVHLPASPPVVEAAIDTLVAAGCRLAAPGEFTLRAFLAGRIDLTQAEAVLGVVDAADRRQLEAALVQLAGGLARPLAAIRESLLELLAHVEAGLDFADEDLAFIAPTELAARLAAGRAMLDQVAGQLRSRGTAHLRTRVVLYGSPNVGKSSLFNALTQSAGAIVSSQAGTTRDWLTASLSVDGHMLELIDTPGSAEPGRDAVAARAQELAANQQAAADVLLLCLDSARRLNAWERARIAEPTLVARFVVLTRCDLPRGTDFAGSAVETSSLTGQGLTALVERLAELGAADPIGETTCVAATAVRCRQSVLAASAALERALELAIGDDPGSNRGEGSDGDCGACGSDGGTTGSSNRGTSSGGDRGTNGGSERGGEELIAAEIRAALDELGLVVGAVFTDDLLDRIFSRFCIGK